MTDLDHDFATEASTTYRDIDANPGLDLASRAVARDGTRPGRRSMSAASGAASRVTSLSN